MEVPNEIVIELTYRCNLNCDFCFNKNQSGELPTANILELINTISDSGIHAVRFSGGEPMLREDAEYIIGYARQKGLYTIVNTNLTVKSRITADLVVISFHDLKMGEVLRRRTPDISGKKMLATIATDENIENLEKFYEEAKSLGPDEWFILRPIPKISFESASKLAKKMRRLNNEYDMSVKIANALPYCSVPGSCADICKGGYFDSGYSRLVIDGHGRIRTDYFSDNVLGSISDNLLDAWNSEYLQKLRGFEFVDSRCKNCTFLYQCMGGLIAKGKPLDSGLINPDNIRQYY